MTTALNDVDASARPGVQAISFHALRWLGRAEAIRQRLAQRPPPPEVDALLCVALSLAWTMTLPPGEQASDAAPTYTAFTLVDQTVEAAKRGEATRHQASFINGCLRRFLREREALASRTDQNPQAVWNHPQWWIDRVRKDHPDQWQHILHANNTQAPLILRVNRRQITRDAYLQLLADAAIDAQPIGADGVLLRHAQAVPSLPGFADGQFSVQDAAAQWAAPLLVTGLRGDLALVGNGSHSQPLRILDACAAPGGKTAHLLELADCDVTALDIDARRCERIVQNMQRLRLQANVVVADAATPERWWDGRLYDGILLDAPCTASGIVRRHPDVRWLRRPTDIAQLANTQRQLLEALWPLVRPGGRLLYCTCSVFSAEGNDQIQTFVTHHTDAALMPSPGHLLPQKGVRHPDFPDNLTGEHDGFYYGLLEKRSG